jgi:hypothetical protein
MALFGDVPHPELIHDMILTAMRLVHDGASRAELKIFRSAMAELRYAFKIFRAYAGCRKVTIFGSARTPLDAPEYAQALALGARLAAQGFMVITGAGPGIMEAAHAGAGRQKSFGVNIRLPFEQTANKHIEGDPKLINFRYFFTRKLVFVREASAIVLFPGGFGTLDEGFETLTLVQTGKSSPIPLILVDRPGGTYWKAWVEFVRNELLGKGLISAEDLSLFTLTEDPAEAAAQISAFYRRYHSIRFVRDQLVVRMLSVLPEGVLEDLNRRFHVLLASPEGRIAAQGPLPEEQDQPELSGLPRLVLPFNRRNFGLLRQMIDRINQA